MQDIVIENISKSYQKGAVQALDSVSFSVEQGELFGLIGPDGAGKTTLFRLLTTLLLPDSGSAAVCGLDIQKDYREIRTIVGYMPGRFSLYQDLSVEENLNFFASVFNTTVEENYDLIRDIYEQIAPFKDRRAGKLSGGMKQKLALCCTLIHRPKVLFLDEPTTGVDVVSRKEFWEMLGRLKSQGITIFVSTPYMDEAVLCERIALIQKGNILSVETPEQIINQFPTALYAIKSYSMGKLLAELRKMAFVDSCNAFGEYHHITFAEDLPENHQKLIELLQKLGYEDVELKKITPTIEDCFIRLSSL
ncbi:MAG: ABC transporter ATP-binding protein [Capnocytophaga sp.]|nr:ABC transporter ATP-binding protein [Capnocytophaga sp.]